MNIKLKEIFFSQFGKMFVFEQFGGLRKPDEFSKAKLLGREALKLGMLKWTKSPIPTSLTTLDPVTAKSATRLFKNVLGFMGDRCATAARAVLPLLNRSLTGYVRPQASPLPQLTGARPARAVSGNP